MSAATQLPHLITVAEFLAWGILARCLAYEVVASNVDATKRGKPQGHLPPVETRGVPADDVGPTQIVSMQPVRA